MTQQPEWFSMANPYQSPAITAPVRPAVTRVSVVKFTLWLYPALLVASLYGTWCVAWLTLGYPPRPSLDDPKRIGFFVDVAYMLSMLILVAFPAAFLLGIVSQLADTRLPMLRRLGQIVILAAIWFATILLLRHDPLLVGEWFMD